MPDRGAACRSARRSRRGWDRPAPPTATPRGSAARASACASARRPRSCSARARTCGTWRTATSGPHQVEHLVTDTLAGHGVHAPDRPTAQSAPQTWDAPGREGLRLLRRVGVVDPSSIDDYRAHGGYEALRRALDIGPEDTIAEITEAKLLGRGGAAFPTGVKWKAVAEQLAHPHYFICNADESEPGTFKDRV